MNTVAKSNTEKTPEFEYAFCTIKNYCRSLRFPGEWISFESEGIIVGDWFYYFSSDYYNHPVLRKKKLTAQDFEVVVSNKDFNKYKRAFVKAQRTKSEGKRALDKIVQAKFKL